MANDYTKVTLSVDQDRSGQFQVHIGVRNKDGSGHGYRLTGPKYIDDSKPVLEIDLTAQDVEEIRRYLAVWDTIHAGDGV
jgi:hypothetical protein